MPDSKWASALPDMIPWSKKITSRSGPMSSFRSAGSVRLDRMATILVFVDQDALGRIISVIVISVTELSLISAVTSFWPRKPAAPVTRTFMAAQG